MLDVTDLLERAKTDRERAARTRAKAARLTGLCDRLQVREGAVVLDRRATVLEAMANRQMVTLARQWRR
ncbi:hypothetical protein [Reyranella sp.]|uniref:hypothetical protein n=1 Tax=Reyranella sp. TaxID=1929291 RepID=UPI003783BD9A